MLEKEQVIREGKADCKHEYVHFRKDLGSELMGCDSCGFKKVFPPGKTSYPPGAYIRMIKSPDLSTYRWKADENGVPQELPDDKKIKYDDISEKLKGGK